MISSSRAESSGRKREGGGGGELMMRLESTSATPFSNGRRPVDM